MRIAVFGLGYVGLTTAGCLTAQGHQVLGVDVDPMKVEMVNDGVAPIREPGLATLISDAVRNGRLEAVARVGRRLNEFDMAIVCVGTPSAVDGSLDLGAVEAVSHQIAGSIDPARHEPLCVVYRPTLRPGSMDSLILPIYRSYLGEAMTGADLYYHPEFLREGVAVKDFFSPAKIVIGAAGGRRSARVDGLHAGFGAPTFYCGYREAEFSKFVDNAFHALKVCFANEIGRLALDIGIDPVEMHRQMVADRKLNISDSYLRPGGAYGGSCLPKDVRALQALSSAVGGVTPVIGALVMSNEAHKAYLYETCVKDLPRQARILMVGVAFKANSDDLRGSPALDLAEQILAAGHDLAIYDPSVDLDALVGENFACANTRLGGLRRWMVDKLTAESGGFDRVIDTNGRSGSLHLGETEVVNLHSLGEKPLKALPRPSATVTPLIRPARSRRRIGPVQTAVGVGQARQG